MAMNTLTIDKDNYDCQAYQGREGEREDHEQVDI